MEKVRKWYLVCITDFFDHDEKEIITAPYNFGPLLKVSIDRYEVLVRVDTRAK